MAADGAEAVAAVAEHEPDVVLMDIRMPRDRRPGGDPPDRARGADRRLQVVILTTFDLDEHVYAALSAGASGFLLKDAPPGSWCTRSGWWPPASAARALGHPSADRELHRDPPAART